MVDFGRNFIPEELTPLSQTPIYRRLEARHRLRYNQLQAFFFNEQIVFFETMIGNGLMRALLREDWPQDVRLSLKQLWSDEVRHTVMFRRLNRYCAPEFYRRSDHHFIQIARPWKALLRWTTGLPHLFPLYLWVMLLQEERSLYYSARFIRSKQTLEPHWVEVYRKHLIDESSHVRCDQDLLDRWWPKVPAHIRRINAQLLAWMVGEFFSAPKRGQLSVVVTLTREYPELQQHLPAMMAQLLDLAEDQGYQQSMYSREITPRTFARFDQWPEFRVLEKAMPGYRSPGSATA